MTDLVVADICEAVFDCRRATEIPVIGIDLNRTGVVARLPSPRSEGTCRLPR